MRPQRLWAHGGLFAASALLLASCQSAATEMGAATEPTPAAAPMEEAREPSTLDGIYTPAQADRGREVYENVCSTCHEAEEWQDELFLQRWNGESVYRFFYYIYERMPNGEPPYSLPRDQVSDVLTYILQLNGLPAGEVELGSDDDSIDQHWLIWSDR